MTTYLSPDKLAVIAAAAVAGLFCLAYQLGRLRQAVCERNQERDLALEVTRHDEPHLQETRAQ